MIRSRHEVRNLLGIGAAVTLAAAALFNLLVGRRFDPEPLAPKAAAPRVVPAAQPAATRAEKPAPWPPGWSDADRLKSATVLRREADMTYFATRGAPVLPGRLSLYFRYRKLLRLYENCAAPPADAMREVRVRLQEIEPAVWQREEELLARLDEMRGRGDFAGARGVVRDLCTLYPDDATDAAPMTRHGDRDKHAQYVALDRSLEDAMNPVRHPEWLGKPIGPEQALQAFREAFEKRFLDGARNYDALRVFRTRREASAAEPTAPSLIDDLEGFLQTFAQDLSRLVMTDWKAVERRARAIGGRPEAAALGEELVAWAKAEAAAQACFGVNGRPPRGRNPEEYFVALGRVPADSIYRVPAVDRRRAIKDSMTQRCVREAADLAGAGEYRGALERMNRLLVTLQREYPDVVERLDPQIEDCERNLKYQDLLAQAENAAAEGRVNDAERLLDAIDAGAPKEIVLKASGLKAEFPTRRVFAQARSFYDAGDGARALEALRDATDPDLVALRERIGKVLELHRAADESMRQGHENEAILLWKEILEVESDDANGFRRAIAGDPRVRAQCLEPADQECAAGARSLEAADWAGAREHFDEALRLFPNHAGASRAIAEFCREAERDFNSDMAMYYKGEMGYEMIRARFEGVLQFLRPADGDEYRSYRDAYEHLQPRMPGGGGKGK